MKRFHFLLFCILLVGLIAKPCFSEEVKAPSLNGYEWESWNNFVKLGWVMGFLRGIHWAIWENHLFLLQFALRKPKDELGTIEWTEQVAHELHNEFMEGIDLGKGTYGQMITGLDEFYKDYRNKRILVVEAMYIVKLEVMGAPRELIDQVTRLLRMPVEERIKEEESLLDGNPAYKKALIKWGKYLPLGVVGERPEAKAMVE